MSPRPRTATDEQILGAAYQVISRVGPAKFTVSCDARSDTYRLGSASFRVLASNGQGSGGPPSSGVKIDRNNGKLQVPNRVDTGLGPTADGGIDPIWLLLPAGLLLIVLAAALRLRRPTRRR